jgi:hypothetical protein
MASKSETGGETARRAVRTEELHGWKKAVTRVVALLEPDESPAAVVYGTITVGAVIAAEGTHVNDIVTLELSSAAVLVLYWLAHSYSDLLGARLADGTQWSMRGAGKVLGNETAILRGAALPLLVILVAWLLGSGVPNAATAGIYTSIAMLILLEIFAGIRIKLTGWALAGQAMVGALFGCGILLVRVFVAI